MNCFTSLYAPLVHRPGMSAPPSPKRERPKLAARFTPWNLSAMQCATLDCLLKSGDNNDVAAEMGLDKKTIELHLRLARKKMGTANRVLQALAWAEFTTKGTTTCTK